MYNCSISIHSKVLKRKVREIAKIKGKELGLSCGSADWCKMVIQIRRELLEKTAELEQKYNYIAPHLRQVYCKKEVNVKGMFNLMFVLEGEEKNEKFSIISDSNNISPNLVLWGIKHRKRLISNATAAENIVREIFKSSQGISSIYQKPFFICESIYFADFYLPNYKAIIEIDGSYHNNPDQIIKDDRRTAYLKSVGIQVYRITNENVNNPESVYEFINNIIQGLSKKKAVKLKIVDKRPQKAKEKPTKMLHCSNYESLNIKLINSLSDLPKQKLDWIKNTRLDLLSDISDVELELSSDLYSSGISIYNKMPFSVSGKVYFVDIYLPDYGIIFDIMGINGIYGVKKEYSQQRVSDLKNTGNIVLAIDAKKIKNKIYRHILIYHILQSKNAIKHHINNINHKIL